MNVDSQNNDGAVICKKVQKKWDFSDFNIIWDISYAYSDVKIIPPAEVHLTYSSRTGSKWVQCQNGSKILSNDLGEWDSKSLKSGFRFWIPFSLELEI